MAETVWRRPCGGIVWRDRVAETAWRRSRGAGLVNGCRVGELGDDFRQRTLQMPSLGLGECRGGSPTRTPWRLIASSAAPRQSLEARVNSADSSFMARA